MQLSDLSKVTLGYYFIPLFVDLGSIRLRHKDSRYDSAPVKTSVSIAMAPTNSNYWVVS